MTISPATTILGKFPPIATLTLALLFGAGTQPVQARDDPILPPGLVAGGPGRVVEVTDGDTVILDDGRTVRLVGIQAPKLPLGRPGFRTWPLAPEARRALETLALDRRVTPHFGGARMDRHGRLLAHLARDDGLWLQGAMLARGLARVYTFEDNRAVAREMYALESTARNAKRGIWSHPYYRIRTTEEAGGHVGGFELVEGRILDVAMVRGRGYLNFGADWRTDFTIVVPKRAGATFRAVFGRKMEKLQGKRVRVRGWLRRYNGPMIESTHPEQIEVLEP
ncbi:MAG: thermonuclease family protein [Alphaproteobacteria bacterium]